MLGSDAIILLGLFNEITARFKFDFSSYGLNCHFAHSEAELQCIFCGLRGHVKASCPEFPVAWLQRLRREKIGLVRFPRTFKSRFTSKRKSTSLKKKKFKSFAVFCAVTLPEVLSHKWPFTTFVPLRSSQMFCPLKGSSLEGQWRMLTTTCWELPWQLLVRYRQYPLRQLNSGYRN